VARRHGLRNAVEEIPADLKEKAQQYRDRLIEALADHDDDFAAKFLDGKEMTKEEIKRVLRKATISGKFFPMLCGTSFKHKGVQPMLDAVCDYLAVSPVDVAAKKGHAPNSETESPANPKTTRPSPPWPSKSRATRTSAK
jgi:elongation factor G